MTTDAPLRCKCRKQAPTSLRCSRCFVPICPDCSRVASVGMLCRECATGKKSHLYEVSAGNLTRGFAFSLAAASFGGWLLATMHSPPYGIGFFFLWLGFLYGLGVAEVALRATGRKRGPQMEIMTGVSCIAGIVIGWGLHALTQGIPEIGSYLLASLKDPWTFVGIAAALFGAIGRIRSL